jgi:hypothetical protein
MTGLPLAAEALAEAEPMIDETPVDLDSHRGLTAQRETDIRRLTAEVKAQEDDLRARQAELESRLLAQPASTWPDAAAKACYLLQILARSPTALDPRRQQLIAAVLEDFERLGGIGVSNVESGTTTN